MFLLNEFKNENIIVAYVNYNLRDDVDVDFNVVNNFCVKNNLKLEVHCINEQHKGNFQEWARKKRYIFFKNIYDKYNCQELIVAHHKDDFLENAIMQWQSRRNPYSFGINRDNKIFGMNVTRPILFKYWKNEIYSLAKKFEIPFNDDWTNFIDKYERNRIRNYLNILPIEIKEMMLKSFQYINVGKSIRKIEVIKKYIEWKETSFNIDFLRDNLTYWDELVFKFLIENISKINISSNILNSIRTFLLTNNGNKEFLLSNGRKMMKLNNNVIIK